jgi:hypothetical protein
MENYYIEKNFWMWHDVLSVVLEMDCPGRHGLYKNSFVSRKEQWTLPLQKGTDAKKHRQDNDSRFIYEKQMHGEGIREFLPSSKTDEEKFKETENKG